jgi:trans-aconitate methyltransferase
LSTTVTATKWNAGLYDDKHAFVFKYGEDLVQLLSPKAGERILDLGCGTGYLSDLIAASGATVTGIDNSASMIEKARASYPQINFVLMAATDFHFENPFDAIFSNAVLHWVKDKESAIDCMYKNLKSNGRLVLEMGGKNNVDSILSATKKVLTTHGFAQQAAANPWYFPSLGEYTGLLEHRGFRVTYATHYDRETELKDDRNGIKDWLKMFGSAFFNDIPEDRLDIILDEIQEMLRPAHFIDGKWWADYKRLRVTAIKQ